LVISPRASCSARSIAADSFCSMRPGYT